MTKSLHLLLIIATVCVAGCASSGSEDTYWRLQDDSFESDFPVSICHVHQKPTQLCAVPVVDGMCIEPGDGLKRARVTTFPYSYWSVSSCSCESFGDSAVIRWVCPECRSTERRWRRHHGYSLDNELECP